MTSPRLSGAAFRFSWPVYRIFGHFVPGEIPDSAIRSFSRTHPPSLYSKNRVVHPPFLGNRERSARSSRTTFAPHPSEFLASRRNAEPDANRLTYRSNPYSDRADVLGCGLLTALNHSAILRQEMREFTRPLFDESDRLAAAFGAFRLVGGDCQMGGMSGRNQRKRNRQHKGD